MDVGNFDYHLPRELIAQSKSSPRDSSRLLHIDASDESPVIHHRRFRDLPEIMRQGDILILNRSRVIPARVSARKKTGGKAEVLFLKKENDSLWEALIGGKGIKAGDRLVCGDNSTVKIKERVQEGKCLVEMEKNGQILNGDRIIEWMNSVGDMPTPPYIKRELKDPEEYQTIYSDEEGSVAAPTAGLHFTDDLMERLKERGVEIRYVTLHVGLGTFAPVKCDNINDHVMEEEWYVIPDDTMESVRSAVKSHESVGSRRIWPVGTTVMRTLESGFDSFGNCLKKEGLSGLFIKPGHRFSLPYAGFITNFHLPRSTPLMLVSAFYDRRKILDAYEEAKRNGYRFYSLGDSMIIDRRGRD